MVERAIRGLPARSVAVQLRSPGAGGRELLSEARALAAVVREGGQMLVVNDRLDVALAVGADGVHLPSAGVPAPDARRLLGPGALVGVSCHSSSDVARAIRGGADFATFGPVFETPSKRAYGAPVGTARLAEAALLGLPLLGLGGVDPSNAAAVMASGASGLAAIRAWLEADDPAEVVRKLLQAVDERGR
jgi:thiamine-phosphate pyrophosphorylase